MNSTVKVQSEILWKQVWGLACLLVAITLAWMAYGFYQPRILNKLGFYQLATNLGIIQGLLGIILEPLVGGYSDRIMQRWGSRLPVLTTGVSLAGLIFVASAFLVETTLSPLLAWLVPVMMTLWVGAMIVFRGPAIALLAQFAPVQELPKANVILTLVFGVTAALGPLLGWILRGVGVKLTFLAGAIILMLGCGLLYQSLPQHRLPPVTTSPPSRSPTLLLFWPFVFLTGSGVGLLLNTALANSPLVLQSQIAFLKTEWIASLILLVGALVSTQLTDVIAQFGSRLALLVGLTAVALTNLLSYLPGGPLFGLLMAIVSGAAVGVILISMVPFTLGCVPLCHAGLTTGLFFGGIAAATTFTTLFQTIWGAGPAGLGRVAIVVGCWLLAIGSVHMASQLAPVKPATPPAFSRLTGEE